jgi:hypothetical protein
VLVLLATTAHADRALTVPQVGAAIRCDGELDEIAWRSPARTGPFSDATGAQAAPYSDARLLRDDKFLYLALYAADEDIRASDEFVVELGGRKLHFTAAGALVPAVPHAQVAIDRDGTLDDARDDDEEWIVEAALPLAALPFASDGSLAVRISRCDVTKDGVKRCGSWRGRIAKR